MKNGIRRVLALILCVVMVFGGNIAVFAENVGHESTTEVEISTVAEETATAAGEVATVAAEVASEEEAISTTEEAVEETATATEVDTEESVGAAGPAASVVESLDTTNNKAEITEEGTEETTETTTEETTEDVTEAITEETTEAATEETTEEIETVVKEPVVFTQEVDGMTITLTGPDTSFEADKEYSLAVTKIRNEDELGTIEEAINKVAEENEKMVTYYEAFDIKLLVDGKEVQPLGPVEVRFSNKTVAEFLEEEKLEAEVIHIDGKTGEAEAMGAVVDTEEEVTIETTHFSTYVYITMANAEGEESPNLLSSGTTSREADKVNKEWPIDKTANGLQSDDTTDVTLTVPGTLEGYIDVVFVLGGGMTANMETIESAINVFKPAMENGKATVRMGLISLEKGKEIILDLNSDEAVLDPATYVDFVTEKFDSINDLPNGTTNLHSQLLEAQKMLAKETQAKASNKYVFVLATGRTYWFDDANGEQAMIVNKVNGTYYWGNYLWQSQRGRNSSLYMIPDRYNNSYEAFFVDIEKWVAADGDTYVFTPHFDPNDYAAYANWYAKNNQDLKALGLAGSRFGLGIMDPKPTADNFITGVPAAIGSEAHPLHALNYERAQYECIQVYKELVAAGYNCYSICSENPNYQNNSEYIKQGAKYTGTSTSQVGHSFMNYLATLGGQKEAPTVWDYERDADGNLLSTKTVLQEDFFDSVRNDILYTCAEGSTVEDYIGKNENGNFEFIQNADFLKLTIEENEKLIDYTAAQIETKEGADSSYAFTAPGANEPTFWVDYYYGDGETTEHFVWTIGEKLSLERKVSLQYKLHLTEKREEEGIYIVPTNNSATLYPVDSDGKEGTPQEFPVPEVEYTVVTEQEVYFKKVSSTNGNLLLSGAVFKITGNGKDETITTKAEENVMLKLKYGDYTIQEITAPSGYALSTVEYTFNLSASGITLTGPRTGISVQNDGTLVITIENAPVYEMPGTGGFGIYWYTISGMVLMMGAALILHNKKYKEVLNK